MSKTALIAGASGLVGSHLLDLLLESDYYENVISIARKTSGRSNEKLEEILLDFDKLSEYGLKADHYFCCLGTTIKKAGSKKDFRKVDLEYPLHLAQIAKQHGAEVYAVITAIGADPGSSFFYNRVKGQLEEKLKAVEVEHVGIFRPAVLLGKREEGRFGESVGKILLNLLDILIPKNYRGIPAENVASAMIEYAKKPQRGFHVVFSGEMGVEED